jgi:hypothetical protein
MRAFEFHAYAGDEHGAVASTPEITTLNFEESAAAKAHGGRLSKRITGPVDIALAGTKPWSDRYITTASPSEHHASGYRFERLDS